MIKLLFSFTLQEYLPGKLAAVIISIANKKGNIELKLVMQNKIIKTGKITVIIFVFLVNT